jgi:DNA-binding CsgD family transcriptional regulator
MTAGPAGFTEASVIRTIEAVYDAAISPDRWMDALGRMRDMLGLCSAAFLVYNADRTQVDGIAACPDPDGHRAVLQAIFRRNVSYWQGPPPRPGMIARNEELVPNEIFQRSEMYQEYWKPRDQQDALRVTISVDEAGVNHQLGLVRAKSASLFDAADIAQVRVLMPHLQRAVALRRRLQHVDLLGAAALKALDTVQHGVLLLDEHRRLMHANAAGDALLCKAAGLGASGLGASGLGASGLGASRGLLVAATAAWTNRLHDALGRAAGTHGTPARASALRLPRPAAGGTLAVLVMPFHHAAHLSLSPRPAVLVCVTDPSAIAVPPARQIADMFGLTGAEAALAAALLAGESVREIAERRGRSVNTVRTQLAMLMAKTEVSRQSELMRLLASLPRLPDPR